MAARLGRPPKPTAIDDGLMAAVRKALLQVARDAHIPTARYPNTADDGQTRQRYEPRALDLAVLAVAAEAALEVLAVEQVAKARLHDEVTWEQIGDAFGTSAQSAHVRFGRSRPPRSAHEITPAGRSA